MEWVGTGRTAALCLPNPPVATVRAAFTAHGDPMRGLTGLSAPSASARIPKPLHLTGLLRTCLSRCGPSPCTQLSCAPSPMATLTPATCIRGFRASCLVRTSAPVYIMSWVSPVHRDGLKRDHVGGGYHTTYTYHRRLLSGHGVDQVPPCHPFGSPRTVTIASECQENISYS
jgi:hypothetical protein